MFRLVFIACWISVTSLGSLALCADKLSRNQVFEVQEKLNLLGFGSGKPWQSAKKHVVPYQPSKLNII